MEAGPDDNNVERLAENNRIRPASYSLISTQPTPQYFSTAGRLQHLCNKYGDFKVARAWKNSDGEMHWSKHRSVMECWESERGIQWLNTVNNRQILPVEIVIDLDDNPTEQRMNEICDKLEKAGEKYKAYHTGSRGYHIHIWDYKLASMPFQMREKVRHLFIGIIGADLMKTSEKMMIALEDAPHWKTGKLKRVVRQNGFTE